MKRERMSLSPLAEKPGCFKAKTPGFSANADTLIKRTQTHELDEIQVFVLGNQLARRALIFLWDAPLASKPVVRVPPKWNVDKDEGEEEVYLRSRSSIASSSSEG